MDQNRDGFIDKNDLRDTFAALGKTPCVSVYVSLALYKCTQSWTLLELMQLVKNESIDHFK